jgi:hypothetical protein
MPRLVACVMGIFGCLPAARMCPVVSVLVAFVAVMVERVLALVRDPLALKDRLRRGGKGCTSCPAAVPAKVPAKL